MELTSTQNPKVKQVIRLRDRKERDETGLFIIEGYRELFRFNAQGGKAEALFFCPELFLGENENALIDEIKSKQAALYPCSKTVFQKLSYRDRPDGLLAIAPQMQRKLSDLILKKNPFLVIAEGIETREDLEKLKALGVRYGQGFLWGKPA